MNQPSGPSSFELPAPLREFVIDHERRRRSIALARAGCIAIGGWFAWVLLCAILDRLIPLYGWVRLILLSAGLIGAMIRLRRPLAQWMRHSMDLSASSLAAESSGEFDGMLHTVVSQALSPANQRGSAQLLQQLADDASRRMLSRPAQQLLPISLLSRPLIGLSFIIALMLVLMGSTWLDLPDLLVRHVAPLSNTPPVTTTRLTIPSPDRDVVQGQPVQIDLHITGQDQTSAIIEWSIDAQLWSRERMTLIDSNHFSYTLPATWRDLQYRISAGDARTPVHHLRILRLPVVREYRIQYQYPEHLNLASLTVTSTDGAIEAPQGTVATVTCLSTEPLASATVHTRDGPQVAPPSVDPLSRTFVIPVSADGDYVLHLESVRSVHADMPRATIRALPDRPPLASIIHPEDELRLAPDATVALRYEAFDDYGLGALSLLVSINGLPPRSFPLPCDGTTRRLQAELSLDLSAFDLKLGDLLELCLQATDRADQTGGAVPRRILIAPRSVSVLARQLVVDLTESRQQMVRLIACIDDFIASVNTARTLGDERQWLSAMSQADYAIADAMETGSTIRQSVLRAIVNSPDGPTATALTQAADSLESALSAIEQLGDVLHDERYRDPTLVHRIDQTVSTLNAISRAIDTIHGGRAAAILRAELTNLDTLRAVASDDAERVLQRGVAAARRDVDTAMSRLGMKKQGPQLQRQLDSMIDDETRLLERAVEPDYADQIVAWASRQAGPGDETFALGRRLQLGARIAAIRTPPDYLWSRDLYLAAQAVSRAQALDGSPRAMPGARARIGAAVKILQDEHRHRFAASSSSAQLEHPVASTADFFADASPTASIGNTARRELAEWANLDPLATMPAPADEAIIADSNAAMINRDYDQAHALDQQWLARMDDAQRSVAAPTLASAVNQARQIDSAATAQQLVRDQTTSDTFVPRSILAERQATIATDISAVTAESPPAGQQQTLDDPSDRQRAIAAIQSAQEQLAVMPQALTGAIAASQSRAQAQSSALAAARAASAAESADAATIGSRIAMQADALLDQADANLENESVPLHPDIARAMLASLQSVLPPSDTALTCVADPLLVSLQQLHQALRAADPAALDQARLQSLQAIERTQNDLRATLARLIQRDPLIAAKWFATAAAQSLDAGPDDLQQVQRYQQIVSESLHRAWIGRVRAAADHRLSHLPVLSPVLNPPGLDPSSFPDAAREMFTRTAPLRPWRHLPSSDASIADLPLNQPDPPEYEQAIDAYFQALRGAASNQATSP